MARRKWLLSVEFDSSADTQSIIDAVNSIIPEPDSIPGATITARSVQELGKYVEKKEDSNVIQGS